MLVMRSAIQGAGLPDDSATVETPLIATAPASPSPSRRRMSVNNIRSVYDRVQRYLTGRAFGRLLNTHPATPKFFVFSDEKSGYILAGD
jgi:hypothetical protein